MKWHHKVSNISSHSSSPCLGDIYNLPCPLTFSAYQTHFPQNAIITFDKSQQCGAHREHNVLHGFNSVAVLAALPPELSWRWEMPQQPQFHHRHCQYRYVYEQLSFDLAAWCKLSGCCQGTSEGTGKTITRMDCVNLEPLANHWSELDFK